MKKRLLYLLLFVILGCSNDDKIEDNNNTAPTLTLNLIKANSYSSNFKYAFSIGFKNIKLIWAKTENVDLNNKIDESSLNTENGEIIINNLLQNSTYYFRLVGEFDDELFYSEIISVNTSKIEILFNKQLFLNTENSWTGDIEKVIKMIDGYIIVVVEGQSYSNNTIVRVIKIDKQFNFQWSFVIDEDTEGSDELAGMFELEDGNFIGIGRNSIYKSYGFKFSNSGTILWIKDYSIASGNVYDSPIDFESYSTELKVPIFSDSTQYDNRDGYHREISLNNDGEIISNDTIGNIFDIPLSRVKYDNYGNKFNYGNYYLTPNEAITNSGVLEKYDINNNLIWHKHYNDDIYGADRLDELLFDENNIINIGTQVDQWGYGTNKDDYRLIHFRDGQGNKLWEFIEMRQNFLYHGNDIIKDSDGNYLYLFTDTYWVDKYIFNLATVLKSDIEGNILWTFHDGGDYNTDLFIPYKIISDNNTYLIFGTNDGVIWLKQFKLE